MAGKKGHIQWKHYRGKLKSAELVIELDGLEEFMRFATDHDIRSIYSLGQKGDIEHFAVSHKGGLMMVAAQGFQELNDYRHAHETGFRDAATYYLAQEKGFGSYEAYRLALNSEMDSPETYVALVEGSYQEGFEEYGKLLEKGLVKADLGTISNAFDLYRKGKEGGFNNWFEMHAAIEKGYSKAANYRAGTAQGYEDAEAYAAAKLGGFANSKEWKHASSCGCTTRREYRSMLDLDTMDTKGVKHDGRVLLTLLSRLPEKTLVPIEKLQKLLEKELELYQDPDSKVFRPWFTIQLRDRNKLVAFLRKNPHVKEFGSYQHDRESFLTHAVAKRQVVLDGSNVAHNSHGNEASVPKVENLERMMTELKKRGFNHIKVIADASLKHKIDDAKGLAEFAEKYDYFESPPNTSADLFVINHVKQHNCLMVSNDRFREWQVLDPWLADNADFYRLTFHITEDKVELPEFDRN